MKVRNGFVSNSSSSSFIVAAKSEKDLKTKITLEVDLMEYVKDSVSTVEELDDYYMEEYGRVPVKADKDEEWKNYSAAVKAIGKGNVVFFGAFHSDGDNSVEHYLCDNGLVKVDKKIVVIESNAGY